MRILINCSNLKVGGGLQVAHSLIMMLDNFESHDFVVVISSYMSEDLMALHYKNVTMCRYDIPSNASQSFLNKDRYLDNLVAVNSIDRVFTVFGPSYWKPAVFHVVGYAKPQYIYLDSPFFSLISFKEKVALKIKSALHLKNFKQTSDVLISENSDVSDRLRSMFPYKPIHTVTNYYNQIFDKPDLWDRTIKLPTFDGFTLLTISANYPHKNLGIINQVIHFLKREYQEVNFRFVLTLEENQWKYDVPLDCRENIVFLGKVDIDQCPYLYEQSDALFLPTLLECFTASYPEAMRMEKPILTSDLNFARGLCKGAALYFDPLDPRDIGNKIYTLFKSDVLKRQLIEEGRERLLKFDDYTTRANKYIEIITH